MGSVMMRWRIISAPVDIGVLDADHVQRLILHLIHQPRRRRRAAVRDSIAVVPRLSVAPSVVNERVILG